MSALRTRRLLFVLFFSTLPLPMLGPFDAFVPAVRFWMLAVAAGGVALAEGAAGPVPMILALLVVHAVLATLAAWLGAWLLARLLGRASSSLRRRVVLGGGLAWLCFVMVVRIYRTAFGAEVHTTLVGVFT